MIKWTYRNGSFLKEEILFIFEHTWLYSYELSVFLTGQDILFMKVPGLEIKRSMGIAKGKDDKIDTTKIVSTGFPRRGKSSTVTSGVTPFDLAISVLYSSGRYHSSLQDKNEPDHL